MFYVDTENMSDAHFKRLTGVKREVFAQMLEVVEQAKIARRKHQKRGAPPKLSNADKLLLLLMYYREYRTMFHIGATYGISESRVCEVIRDLESILIKDPRFHLPGKKSLVKPEDNVGIVVVDATESPVERPKKNRN